MNKDRDLQRMHLWCAVYVAYVNSSNSTKPEGAKNWANIAIKAFDETFHQSPSSAPPDVPAKEN